MSGGDVLLLDDDEDVRDALADMLMLAARRSSVRCASFEELDGERERVLACTLAIVDVNLGPRRRTGLDACHWLRQNGFAGRIIILTGHGTGDPLVRQACERAGAELLLKPIGLDEIKALLRRDDVAGSPSSSDAAPMPLPSLARRDALS